MSAAATSRFPELGCSWSVSRTARREARSRRAVALLPMALSLLLAASGGAGAQPAPEPVLTIVADDPLREWGYYTVASGRRDQSEWQAATFGEAEIRIQAIRSIEEAPNWPGAFYRFTLVEEHHATPEAARARFERLREHEPGLDTKAHPELVLRDGFVLARRVIYATTDVARFRDEAMPRLLDRLREHLEPAAPAEEPKGRPILTAVEEFTVGEAFVIETNATDLPRGVVFEDDGQTGYFYARDFSLPDGPAVDALHIYTVEAVSDRHIPSKAMILWTADYRYAALLINRSPHAIFDFEEKVGYSRDNFPEPDPRYGWTHQPWKAELRGIFYP